MIVHSWIPFMHPNAILLHSSLYSVFGTTKHISYLHSSKVVFHVKFYVRLFNRNCLYLLGDNCSLVNQIVSFGLVSQIVVHHLPQHKVRSQVPNTQFDQLSTISLQSFNVIKMSWINNRIHYLYIIACSTISNTNKQHSLIAWSMLNRRNYLEYTLHRLHTAHG